MVLWKEAKPVVTSELSEKHGMVVQGVAFLPSFGQMVKLSSSAILRRIMPYWLPEV